MKVLNLILIITILTSILFAGHWVDNPTPIFDPGEAHSPTILYDKNSFSGHGESYKYKMWYEGGTHKTNVNSKIRIAGSDDGINWTIIETNLTGIRNNGGHPEVLYDENGFGGTGYFYKIWYWPGYSLKNVYTNAIHFAVSTDGKYWENATIATQNPTKKLFMGANAGYWNNGSFGPFAVTYNQEAANSGTNPFDYSYYMYYSACVNWSAETIGLAYSTNGIYWSLYGQVLTAGGLGKWDENQATMPVVIKEKDKLWKMWYCGGKTYDYEGIGEAYSTNGIDWTRLDDLPYIGSNASPAGKAGNPIFYTNDGNSMRDSKTYEPEVLYDADSFGEGSSGHNYKMWFSGKSSSDGIRRIFYSYYVKDFPAQPENIAAIPTIDYTKILINWHDAATNENYYLIEKKESVETNFSTIATLPSNSSNYIDKNVALGKKYIYRVSAYNIDGSSSSIISNQLIITNSLIKIKAEDLSNDQGYGLIINWSIPKNTFYSISNINSYILYRGSTTNSATNQIAILTNKTSFTDLSVIKTNSYVYKIYALNSGNFVDGNYSNPAEPIDNIAPQMPLSINISYSAGDVLVKWSKSPDDGDGANDVIAYRIGREASTTGIFSNIVIISNTTSFIDQTPTGGEEYKYTVSAYDGKNFSQSIISTNMVPVYSSDEIQIYNNYIDLNNEEQAILYIPINIKLKIYIYSLNGSLIKDYPQKEYIAESTVVWDGTYKDTDSKVGAGVYFIIVKGENIKKKFTVLVVK